MTAQDKAAPPVATISGVEVVTIPLADYVRFLDAERQLAAGRITPERFVADLRSRVDRDPEVARFLADCLGRMLLKDAVVACREQFGKQRAPGQSTIGRYWARLRRLKTTPGGFG